MVDYGEKPNPPYRESAVAYRRVCAYYFLMSDYRRLYVPGGTYFFTVNLQNRRQTLLVDHIDAFRIAYKNVHKKYPFKTLAICILPDHLHCIWELPDGDADFSTRWRLIKTGFSKAIGTDDSNGKRLGEAGIWQRRFWEHMIDGNAELDNYIGYIYNNPVKHGYVENVEDWPHSSYHRLVSEDYLPASELPKHLNTGEV